MKRTEAIERLKQNKSAVEFHTQLVGNSKSIDNDLKEIEAFNMAIEALSKDATIDNTQYEWIVEHSGDGWDDWINLTCPKCGEKHEQVPYYYNFCPNCGVKIKVSKDTTKESEEIGCVYQKF